MDETSVFSSDSPVEVPVDGFERAERIVLVAGQERRLPVLSHGNCEALRFVHDSMVITAVARLGFPESPRFDVVDDLEPYLAAHRRFILQLATVLGTVTLTRQTSRQRARSPGPACSSPVFLAGAESLRVGAGSGLAKPSPSDARRAA